MSWLDSRLPAIRSSCAASLLRSALAAVLLSSLSAAVVGVSQAGEGVRLEVEFLVAGNTTPVKRATVWISDRRVRIDQVISTSKAEGVRLVYRGDTDRLYSLDPGEKAYIAVDRNLVISLGKHLHAARREFGQQLDTLPPDQRAAMERLLGLRLAKAQTTTRPLIVSDAAGEVIVQGMHCRQKVLRRDKKKVGEACVVPWHEMGIEQSDLEVFRQLANFQRELMGSRGLTPLEIVPNQSLDFVAQLDGFPMYYRRMNDEIELSSIRVARVTPIEGADDLFDVPPDYTLRGGFSEMFGAVMGGPSPGSAQVD